jgi:hypothetical protein
MSALAFTGFLFLLGAFASFFAGLLGLGGGVLIIPGLNSLFSYTDLPPNMIMKLSLGTSLATVFFTALISMRAHSKFAAVNWTVVSLMVPGLVIGGGIGPLLSSHLPPLLLVGLFSSMLFYLGVKFLLNGHVPRGHAPLNIGLITFMSFFMGIAASMLGLGGGILMIPFLSRFDLDMKEIVAISAVCLIPASFMGTLGYLYAGWGLPNLPAYSTGYIDWRAVAPLVAASFIFAPIGVRLVHTLPHSIVRHIFGVVLILISLHMIWNAI